MCTVWMGLVGAVRAVWRPVGKRRDAAVDGPGRPWTTRSWSELSTGRPRVVHGSRRVHPRPAATPSTELSPGVGGVRAHGNGLRPIDDGRVTTVAAGESLEISGSCRSRNTG